MKHAGSLQLRLKIMPPPRKSSALKDYISEVKLLCIYHKFPYVVAASHVGPLKIRMLEAGLSCRLPCCFSVASASLAAEPKPVTVSVSWKLAAGGLAQ